MNTIEELIRKIKRIDYLLLILVVGISVFGIIIIGSATKIYSGNSISMYRSQQIWFASGLVVMLLISLINYEFICRFYIVIYIFNILLLLFVLIAGSTQDSVVRTISLGDFGSILPSEFAKVFMIIFLAKFVDKQNDDINNGKILGLIILSIILPVTLIMIQPSLSASLVVLVISFVVLFVAGLSYKYILVTIGLGAPILTMIYLDIVREKHLFIDKLLLDYQIKRVQLLIAPSLSEDGSFQSQNSIKAIGSGLLHGKGLYEGTMNQLNLIPKSSNDFVFAVIGEELGFVGCVVVLLVMFLIITKCIIISAKAVDLQGRLISAGVAGMLAFETIVNVGVATGLMPNTGMTLPFISAGGSAMWTNMIAIGLVLNISTSKPKSLFEG